MSDAAPYPAPLVWPEPTAIVGPAGIAEAAVLHRIGIPTWTDANVEDWLPALVSTKRLHPAEAAVAEAMSANQRSTFVAGRLALRSAMTAGSPTDAAQAVLRDARGAPVLPSMVSGSVSHKQHAALAFVLPRTSGTGIRHVGVDLEHRPTARDVARPSIARRILTPSEIDALAVYDPDPLRQRERVILSFALKEAIYKAIDPTVQRYVRFTEVSLQFHRAGEADVVLLLPELRDRPVTVQAHYTFDEQWLIATAVATDES